MNNSPAAILAFVACVLLCVGSIVIGLIWPRIAECWRIAWTPGYWYGIESPRHREPLRLPSLPDDVQ
jgi:hypothetical protein